METTEKFTGKSDYYSKHRPNYPAEYVRYLIGYSRLSPEKTIADIGAGTGKLTRQLLEEGLSVIAVEPNGDMRAVAEKTLAGYPRFSSKSAAAEETGLQAHSVDLITVAQAFHWFDREKFKLECRRILKPGANVALVWNSRDSKSPLVMENAEICRKLCPSFNGFSGGIDESPDVFRQFFKDGCYEEKAFPNDLEFDLDGFIGRNLSASYGPKSTDASYDEFVGEITKLFEKYSVGDKIIMPNFTRSYIGRV